MARLIALLIAGAVTVATAGNAEASDWAFKRSWFSHGVAPGHPVPMLRSALRPALPQVGPGFAVRSSYRYNVYRIRNGNSYDTTIFRQFSIQDRVFP